jgi:uncharacterized membrane protein YraQ (UPF0718 family)
MLSVTWSILCESAFYILVGFFVAGLLEGMLSSERSLRFLSENRPRSVLLATLIGAPLPLCSCSVLPAAVTLRRKGASKGAMLAFLISTPETSATSVLLTYSLLGPLMAVYRPIATCVTAIVAGLIENVLERRFPSPEATDKEEVSHDECSDAPAPAKPQSCCHDGSGAETRPVSSRFRAAMCYAFVDLFDDLFGWILLGVVVAGMIQAWLPPETLKQVLGGPLQSMLLMVVIGVPLYVCAESSTPIAAALVANGMNPGAALVFLLVGPATNIGSLGILYRQLGLRTISVYLAAIVIIAMLMGGLLNAILEGSQVAVTAHVMGEHHVPRQFKTIGALVFLGLGAATVLRSQFIQRLVRRPAP